MAGEESARPRSYRQRVRAKISPFVGTADLDDVVEFRRSTFGPSASIALPEYVQWMYGDAAGRDATRLWIFRSDNKIEGFQGVVPTTLHVDGRPLDAMWAAELFVSPAYRLRGVGAVLADLPVENSRVTMAFEVTDIAKRSFVRAGWTDLGAVTMFVRPIKVAAISQAHGRVLTGPVAKLLELALRAHEAAALTVNRLRRIRLVSIPRFDARADALWKQVAPKYRVIALRDARTLNWQFVDCPSEHQYRCFYLQRGDRVIGYAVVRLGEHGSVTAGWLVDFLCEPRWARSLIVACVRTLRSDGAEAIYGIQQSARLKRAFVLNGFLRRTTGWPLLAISNHVDESTRCTILDPGAWFITSADSNVDRSRHGLEYAT